MGTPSAFNDLMNKPNVKEWLKTSIGYMGPKPMVNEVMMQWIPNHGTHWVAVLMTLP